MRTAPGRARACRARSPASLRPSPPRRPSSRPTGPLSATSRPSSPVSWPSVSPRALLLILPWSVLPSGSLLRGPRRPRRVLHILRIRTVPVHHPIDFATQSVRQAPLGNEGVAARVARALRVPCKGVSRQCDDRDGPRPLVILEPAGRFPAVHPRQRQVH